MVASTSEIRQRFPALGRKRDGRPVAYFDGPGGTQVPRQVAEAVEEYLLRHNANAGWNYPTSRETDSILEEGRRAMADLLGAEPREIVFGANMTTLTFHVARALGRRWEAGEEVVVTELDHHANVAPWRAVAAERDVAVRTVRMDPARGRLDWEDFRRKVSPDTRLVAVGAASNALGTVNAVDRARDLARSHGALLYVDAVHLAPHALLDVREMGADFLACSAYKFYGPHVGVLYGRADRLESLPLPPFRPAPGGIPQRAETGTLNHEGIAGTAAAVDFLASLAGEDRGDGRRERLRRSFAALEERGRRLLARLWEGLTSVPGVEVHGPPPETPRTPTVAFHAASRPPGAVAAALARRGVFVTHGDFYASTVADRLGRADSGLLRAGCACYTTPGEVDRLISAVEEAVEPAG